MVTALNGRMNVAFLQPVTGGFPQQYLLHPAARSWEAVRKEVHRRYGWWPILSRGSAAYRSLEQQNAFFFDRFTRAYLPGRPRRWHLGDWWYLKIGRASAATPGRSNHGEGNAIDVSGLGWFGSARYRQFEQVASEYGWNNTEGRGIQEPWHWCYEQNYDRGNYNTPAQPARPAPAPIEEDPLSQITLDQIRAVVREEVAAGLAAVEQNVHDIEVKMRRQDLQFIHFKIKGDPIDRWCVADRRTMTWMIPPSAEAFNKHVDVLGRTGIPTGRDSWAVKTWDRLSKDGTVYVHDPEAFGPRREWSDYEVELNNVLADATINTPTED